MRMQDLPSTTFTYIMLLLLSRFSRVWLCVTPQTAAHQAPPSLGFSRQEYWSGLPFPSPMHESEKWKWSHLVVSDSMRPCGLQPTRLLHPWDFPGKNTGAGCHCLLPYTSYSTVNYVYHVVLYVPSIYLITENLYFLTTFVQFPHLYPPHLITTNLISLSVRFFFLKYNWPKTLY